MTRVIQDKVLFYGGNLLIALGILAICLFSFSSDLEKIPKEIITGMIIIVFGTSMIMIIMGLKFFEEGLHYYPNEKP